MEYLNGYAEQYKDWSDCFPAGLDCRVAHAAAYDRQAITCPQPAGDTRIIDHTVHAVWQTALPVCDRTRAWPQILSLSEQSGETPPPHLYISGDRRTGSGAIVTAAHISRALGGVVRYCLRVTDATS